MVGQTILHEGTLDVKSPPSSSFTRGWRLPPWKVRHVQLVHNDSGDTELNIYKKKDDALVDVYRLFDITDITMVASKTHAHAFEIRSHDTTVIVMSGNTELESREWIWELRKVFWPQAIPQMEENERISIQLLRNADTEVIGLSPGIYNVKLSVDSMEISLETSCEPGDRSSTPVQAFTSGDTMERARLPITMIGRLRVEGGSDSTCRLVLETIPDSSIGARTLVFQQSDDTNKSITDVADAIRNVLFQATNNLHDCISRSQWTAGTTA